MTTTINIARDFSKYPGGRYTSDGKFTGQRFREEVLVPALRQYNKVTIEFDEASGFGSSFLEEAFGGLVRVEGFTAKDIEDRIQIKTEDEDLDYAVRRYIQDAGSRSLVAH